MNLHYFGRENFRELLINKDLDLEKIQQIACAMLRVNILSGIQNAGSGHLGTSFSATEIMISSIMYLETSQSKNTHFFSSKGHDVPALYACYEALGKLENESLMKLRKLGGLPGHPDVSVSSILFNTGSLGMGISKANGWLSGKSYQKEPADIIVLIGDGEFQEGQNFEALMYLQNNGNLKPLIIMDSNKIQSDSWVNNVKSYEKFEDKIKSFGLKYKEVDGHDLNALNAAYKEHFDSSGNGATVICANTIKGKGLGFAETSVSDDTLELYGYHSGALSLDDFAQASNILMMEFASLCNKYNYSSDRETKIFSQIDVRVSHEVQSNLLQTYTASSVSFFKKNNNNVALDADLLKDAGSLEIKRQLPNQFFEFGIAEQDMVSFGAGLAASGVVPWCHSFSCFLTTRAQEQIFNFCSERRKGIFIGALAGPIPAGPGHSHQMIRDISIMSSMPFLKVFEPVSPKMLNQFFDYQTELEVSIFVRLANCNLDLKKYSDVEIPPIGELVTIVPVDENTKKVVILQGAILFSEIIKVIDDLKRQGNIAIFVAVWLNEISNKFLECLAGKHIFIFETSVYDGDFASNISVRIHENTICVGSFFRRAFNDLPECGANDEVLRHHLLDGYSIMKKVVE